MSVPENSTESPHHLCHDSCTFHALISTPIVLFVPAFTILFFLIAFFIVYFFRNSIRNYFLRGYLHRIALSRQPISPESPLSQGLDKRILESFPIFLHRKSEEGKVGPDCPICLSEFEEGVEVRLLTSCCHAFHPSCIDPWLAERATCPVCRSDLTVPPNVTTVLEVNEVLDSHVIDVNRR